MKTATTATTETMEIGELSRRTGIPASAIRYYESLGLVGKTPRKGGRRRYTEAGVERLTFIACAREVGFTLREIRELIGGFPVARWRPLVERKIHELDRMSLRIRRMRSLLEEHLECTCLDVDACGRVLLHHRAERRDARGTERRRT